MNLEKLRCLFFCLVFGALGFKTNAQQPNTLYFMKEIFQSSYLNPAFSPANNFVIGLPFMSGINIAFNNDFNINEITEKGNGLFSDTLKFNFNSFYDVMSDRSKANFEVDASMFFIGIKNGKNYYSVSVNEKGFFRGEFDKKFVDYFKNGIKPYYGKDADLGILAVNLAQYREFAFGISQQAANKKFTYGAKLKLLFGRMNINSKQLGFQVKSTIGDDYLYLHPSGSMDISGPVKFVVDTVEQSTRLRNDLHPSDYIFNFRNLGLAADLGFDFQANKQFNFSASIIDLGFLRFSKKNYILNAGYNLEYEKDKLTQATDPSAPDYFSGNGAFYAFRDSIPFMTSATTSAKTQWINLPVKFYIGATYQVNKKTSLGFVEKLYFLKNYFYSATTFSAKTTLSDNFSILGSYTTLRNSFFNLGFGGIYNSESLQFYFNTDNFFSLIKPSGVKNLNLHLGLNLIIGKE